MNTMFESKKVMDAFSSNLQKIRESKGLSRKDAAELLGVSDTMVRLWETGVNYPKMEMLGRIAAVYCCPMNMFFSSDDVFVGEDVRSDIMLSLTDQLDDVLNQMRIQWRCMEHTHGNATDELDDIKITRYLDSMAFMSLEIRTALRKYCAANQIEEGADEVEVFEDLGQALETDKLQFGNRFGYMTPERRAWIGLHLEADGDEDLWKYVQDVVKQAVADGDSIDFVSDPKLKPGMVKWIMEILKFRRDVKCPVETESDASAE